MRPETAADRTPTDHERELGRAAIARILAELKDKKSVRQATFESVPRTPEPETDVF